MKILHIDETFHPSFGYQCSPLAKFQSLAENEVFIIAPEAKFLYPVYKKFGETGTNLSSQDDAYTKETGVKIIRIKAHGYIANRLNYYKSQLYKAIETVHPDVIMVHCVETLTAMRVMRKYKNKYPMVFDSHMLSMASANRFSKEFEKAYRLLFTRLIVKKHYTVIRTQDDDYVFSHLGIPAEQAPFISFGTDVVLFAPKEELKRVFLKENGLPEDSFVITSTGKVSKAKGGMLLAEMLKERFDGPRNVVAVIVANFDGEYESEVKKTLDQSENKIFFYPVQNYRDLPWFYQIADVVVFPRQCSMSFYDAQSCGTPVISETGHVNEERNSHGNGLCFQAGSVADFKKCVNRLINMAPEEYQTMRTRAREFIDNGYSYTDIAQRYVDEYEKAIALFQEKRKTKK